MLGRHCDREGSAQVTASAGATDVGWDLAASSRMPAEYERMSVHRCTIVSREGK
jgi:hypothetical protein